MKSELRMLAKLVLINSSSYKIAELNFEGSRSLQLVGPNNVGKSSLIYALNFVFLVNKKLMNFSGQRPADKDTVAHYFPDAERSYIVFEVSKRGRRYCVLVRWDGRRSCITPRWTLLIIRTSSLSLRPKAGRWPTAKTGSSATWRIKRKT